MVAKRMARIAGSETLKQGEMVERLRREGIDVVSFTVGEPDFDTPKNVVDAAVESMRKGETHYGPSAGLMPLRQAVAEKLADENRIPCTYENILISPAKHLIYMAIMALVEDNDEVIIPSPCWPSYGPQVKLAGARPVFAQGDAKKGFALDPDNIQRMLTTRTRAIIINSPCNPTGNVATRKELEGVAKLCRDENIHVISDEIYENLVYEGEHVSMASLPGMDKLTVTVSGLSKSHAMTGWRSGWACAPSDVFKEMLKLQQHTMTCSPAFVQRGMLEALNGPDKDEKRFFKEFSKRRKLMVDLIRENDLLTLDKVPEGTFYLFPRFNLDMTSWDLAEVILRKGHVGVTAGDAFGEGGSGHLRLSYATSAARIVEGMNRIDDVMDEL